MILKIILATLGAIGALNLGIGVLMAAERVFKEIGEKWGVIYLVATSIGVAALMIVMDWEIG